MATKSVAVRKRQQIENANRTMFIWVALASAVLGAAGVLTNSLFQRLSFNQEVLTAKNETVANLDHNNKVVSKLKDQIRVRNTNEDLLDTPRPEGREPISVILDALPSSGNSAALGASLQQRILDGGVSIESLNVDPVALDKSSKSKKKKDSVQKINFSFTVSAGATQVSLMRDVLTKLERSIRTIDVETITLEQQNSRVSLSVTGVAYYLPEKQVELVKESV